MDTAESRLSQRSKSEALTTAAYAHTRADAPESAWEPLNVHLTNVATLAERFAASFDSAAWGRIAGLWHDLGKYRPEFQARLRGDRIHAEHSGLGAALAASNGGLGAAVAFAIAGHHTGLANREAQGDSSVRPLRYRVESNAQDLARLLPLLPVDIVDCHLPIPPAFLLPSPHQSKSAQELATYRVELWTRFLFSALVDADRLATEAFYEPGKRETGRSFDSISMLRAKLDRRLAKFTAHSSVNRIRAEVLRACRATADRSPGLFTLTVPTGGGKTLSSMAFALRHAERHNLRRVIVVIPYTSIIEQNARVYGGALGNHNVIEHHSTIDEAQRLEHDAEAEIRRRLACENWDAPVIVTTNVQFFETLFASHPSRCRKLHNIARSVVLLDEAQNIPVDFLNCSVDAMKELTTNYGCSVVLMTATQPALRRRDAMPFGFESLEEIAPDPLRIARALDRVQIHWPDLDAPPTSYSNLAIQIAQHQRVLAIVHRRQDARELARQLPAGDRYHLSALMCPAHRTQTLSVVRDRLNAGAPCRLVATQLVEAGVDIDFPVVYRALAGLDSLAQAAGRCNREGRLRGAKGEPVKGEFHVFCAETNPPPGLLRKGLESTEALLQRYGDRLNFSEGRFLEEYFRILYSKCDTDRKGVQAERRYFNFANVAAKVRLIEDGYIHPVVVRWGDATERVRAFRTWPNRQTQRALQPFIVQIPEFELMKLEKVGAVEHLHEAVHVLTPGFEHLYDAEWGLVVDEEALPDPEARII